jgi:hypothetical protein
MGRSGLANHWGNDAAARYLNRAVALDPDGPAGKQAKALLATFPHK